MEENVEKLKKRLRLMSIMIGTLSFITLTSFVYCYKQIRRAKEELELAQKYEQIASRTRELEQCKKDFFETLILAQKNAEEAMKQKKLAEAAEEALKKISKK